ncbi:acyltransferase family protein [Nocardioides sp. C4-1]|uniref:acyltransferase family protein n=1 Tax=Nocardioides sp. C4-1 TaxID=3151851 RepID=UPI003265616B
MSTRPPTPSATLSYRPDLDGLRAVAVYLVLAFHAQVALLDGGFVGVDLFFVLSGFLVTGVLLRDRQADGRVRLGRFYARRVRRLLPAALVVVVVTALLQLLLLSLPARLDLVDDARASVLYVANWHFVLESRDYFAQDDAAASPFLHFWSLSIEEQFYIVFPVVVLLVVRLSRRPVRALAAVLALVVVASALAQVVTAASDPNLAYYGTHTRVYQLAAGGLLMTIVLRRAAHHQHDDRRPAGTTGALAWPLAAGVGLVVLLVTASDAVGLTASERGLVATAASALTIAGLWCAPAGPVARLLALPVPRYLGQVSYGTYVWHWPVTLVVQRVFEVTAVVDLVITAVVATALAALSYRLVEVPVRTARPLHRVPWVVVGAGLATSVVVATAVTPVVLDRDARPAVAGDRGPVVDIGDPALRGPVPPDLDLVAASDDFGSDTATPCTVADPAACRLVEGPDDAPHVLLLGDSQANTLVPALEQLAVEQGFRLSTNVRSGCPWQADQVNTMRGNPDGQQACAEVRRTFFSAVLPLMDVDVVLAVGLSRSDPAWEPYLSSPSSPTGGESLAELQARTTRETAALVTAAGPRLAIVHSMFGPAGYEARGTNPIECLAAARTLGECAVVVPPRQPSVDDVYGLLDTESPDVATLDLTRTICPDYPVCHPVVDGQVVWMDADHVTSTYLREHRDEVWAALEATGFVTR